MGFEGMGCIHPRQIAVIARDSLRQHEETERAKKIVVAYRDAIQRGLEWWPSGSKMIDPPVVASAQKTITWPYAWKLCPQNWMEKRVRNNI